MADAEKKTKREKLLEKEEKKREKRIMKEKSKQYDGGFTARCVALLLGFVLGVAGTIGGAAGAGYYIVSHKSVKEVAGIAGGDKFDLDKYLSAEYSEKTLLPIFQRSRRRYFETERRRSFDFHACGNLSLRFGYCG